MKIERIILPPLDNNVYVIGDDKNVIIVDPASSYDKIMEVVKERTVLAVLVTHKHFDHIGALKDFKKRNILEYSFDTIKDNKLIIGNFHFKVMYNPGHSKDSISFIIDNHMFSGDFIFKEAIGRTDFPGGSLKEMVDSIKKFKKLNKNYYIYPGHGEFTTYSDEMMNNPYLNFYG